jgi:mannose-6-phosphate isomerase-like protein (cupin superfamily)
MRMTSNRKQPSFYRLADQPKVSGSALGYHRGVPGDGVNFLQAHLRAGFKFPMHIHKNEQFTYVLSGASRISFADGTASITVRSGEVINIPGGMPHDIEVLEDTIQIEIFAPARNDLVTEMPKAGPPVSKDEP